MSRPARSRVDIDYKIWGTTGEKVTKVRDTNKKMDEVKTKAIHSRADVEDLFDFYDLDELEGEEELQEYVTKCEEVKRDFRRIHAQFKSMVGDEMFTQHYPDYSDDLATLTLTLKKCH